MEVILTNQVDALFGTLDDTGYLLRRSAKGRIFSMRNPKVQPPPDGQWRFICRCAQLARTHLYLDDIRVTAGELDDALEEATNGELQSPWAPRDAIVNAEQVLKLRKELGL